MRYLDVAQALRTRIVAGQLRTDGALPSESELGAQFGVSRVTVRKALEALRDEGLVASRKGAGWFVAVDPVRQALGRFTTVEAALSEAGIASERRVVEFGFEPAAADVAAPLQVAEASEVLRVRRVNLAGGEPLAVVTVWAPAELAADLSRADVERATFYDLLPLHGVQLGGARQTISAAVATDTDARLLQVAKATAVLVCHRLTTDTAGRPVLWSEHRYAGHRTVLEVEFPRVGPSQAHGPDGVRVIGSATSSRRRST